MCEMTSANYAAWHGVSCSWNGTACSHFSSQHNDYCALRSNETACLQSGSVWIRFTVFIRRFRCGSPIPKRALTTKIARFRQSTQLRASRRRGNASMLSTGAHAAITEYAMLEQRWYTCDLLDESTNVRRRVQLLRCSGTTSTNDASCSSRDGTTCEEITVFGTRLGSLGLCSGNHTNCETATSQEQCEDGLENN